MQITVHAYTWMSQVIVEAVDHHVDAEGVKHHELMGRVAVPAPRWWVGDACDGLALVAEALQELAYK